MKIDPVDVAIVALYGPDTPALDQHELELLIDSVERERQEALAAR